MKRFTTPLAAFTLAALLGASGSLSAAVFNYGDLTTLNGLLEFTDMREDTGAEPTPLFGAPTATANGILFNSLSFELESTASETGGKIQDSEFRSFLSTTPLAAGGIPEIEIYETGDFSFSGTPRDNNTIASVSAAVFVSILEVDGAPIAPLSLSGNLQFERQDAGGVYGPGAGLNGSNFLYGDVSGGLPVAGRLWRGEAVFDVDAFLAGQGIDGQATKLEWVIDNTLLVESVDGTSVFIRKKQGNVGVVGVQIIPEPSALVLLGLGAGAGALLIYRRRK